MSLIRKVLKMKAVWWERSGIDGFGRFTYHNPIQVSCFWVDVSKEFRKKDGTVTQSRALVQVDRDMKDGDRLRRGPLSEIANVNDDGEFSGLSASSAAADTLPGPDDEGVTDAWEIMTFEKVPNMKVTEYFRQAYL